MQNEIRVRVAETDALGHINNANYFTYMEDTRLQFLQHLGMDFNNREASFVLASTTCDFIKQGYFGQILKVDVKIDKIGRSSITIRNDIREKESDDPIARGWATIVYFDRINQQSTPLPDWLREKLDEYSRQEK